MVTSCVGSALKRVIERKIEGNRRRGSRPKQLLEDIKERENAGNGKRKH